MVSIVVPLSRDNAAVGECFRSIAAQTYQDFEIIVTKSDNNNIARNNGAKKASGDFLFFCDDDIILEKDCLYKMQMELACSPNASYAYCNYNRIGICQNRPHIAKPFSPSDLIADNFISTMSLIRRDHFVGFDPSIGRLQDWDMWLNMLLNFGYSGIWINEILFTALYDTNSISRRDDWKKWNDIIRKKYEI